VPNVGRIERSAEYPNSHLVTSRESKAPARRLP
jgi:hypothetical protein